MDIENFKAAEEAYRQAVQLFAKVSDLEAVASVRVSLGRVYASNQAPFDALLQWRQALELYRELQQDDKVEFVEESAEDERPNVKDKMMFNAIRQRTVARLFKVIRRLEEKRNARVV